MLTLSFVNKRYFSSLISAFMPMLLPMGSIIFRLILQSKPLHNRIAVPLAFFLLLLFNLFNTLFLHVVYITLCNTKDAIQPLALLLSWANSIGALTAFGFPLLFFVCCRMRFLKKYNTRFLLPAPCKHCSPFLKKLLRPLTLKDNNLKSSDTIFKFVFFPTHNQRPDAEAIQFKYKASCLLFCQNILQAVKASIYIYFFGFLHF